MSKVKANDYVADGEKVCSVCGEITPLDNFAPDNRKLDGKQGICRGCQNINDKKRAKTKRGKITSIYGTQLASSKKRGHKPPEYSNKWLQAFDSDTFDKLFKIWAESGFDRMLAPSIDRIKNNTGYTEANIRWVSWQENFDNAHRDHMNGELIFDLKSVKSIDSSGVEKEYISINEASRLTNAYGTAISRVCYGAPVKDGRGKWYTPRTADGYRWEFT